MKKMLLTAATVFSLFTVAAVASVPALMGHGQFGHASNADVQQVKQNRGGDNKGGNDRRGGRRNDDSSNDDRRSNGNASGSGRSKPRIPGGSGCDDPGDIAEHAACRP